MGQSISECKPCKVADPVASTVKVDPTLLAGAEGLKAHRPDDADQQARQEAEEIRLLEEKRAERERLQAEEERLRRQAEEEEHEDARRQPEEARRHAEQEVERLRQEEMELAEKLAQDERQRAAAAEHAKSEAARAAAAKAKAEAEAAQKVVDKFLKSRGFKNLQTPRKAFCGGAAYPFHLAVQEGDADLVKAMLLCGASREQKNGAKLSPLQVAERCNKKGSHALVVQLLRA